MNTIEQAAFVWKELGEGQLQALTQVTAGTEGISILRSEKGWEVTLGERGWLSRAIALIKAHREAPVGFQLSQQPCYKQLGAMLDCSRNAVPTVKTVKQFIRTLSMMGYNTLQLYMEDVFLLEDYPYFSYGRGAYTDGELRELDDYGYAFGIEVIPAIQTLAHQGQALKWDAMRPYVDCGDILLMDDDKTYELINAMFAKMRACLRTPNINIGMDEAHMLGLGRYLDEHGYTDRTDLMLRHFERVHQMANAHGFKPMLWSDMFFRLATKGEYYQPDSPLDPSIAKRLPADTSLIYWDYYSDEKEIYDAMLSKHLQLTPNTIFASGAWKWSGFSPCNHFSIDRGRLAHEACIQQGISNVLVTMWADNGAECSLFAVLPSLQYWAELCWCGQADEAQLKAQFAACTDGKWDDFMALDEPVFTPDNPAPGRCAVNATKTLLYEDVLIPLFSHQMDVVAYGKHLKQSEEKLAAAAQNENWSYLFECNAQLCKVLRDKCEVQAALQKGWQQKDAQLLQRVCQQLLPVLEADLQAFITSLHKRWLTENKAAGMDVLDIRLGGLMQRCKTAQERLQAYLAGEFQTIEELDMPLLPYSQRAQQAGFQDPMAPFWHLIVSPSCIAMI